MASGMDFDMDMVQEDISPDAMHVVPLSSANYSPGGFAPVQEVAIRKTFPEAWIWHDYSNERFVL